MAIRGRRGGGSSRAPVVDVVALGGLNEFGTNALAVSSGESAILIDAGGVVPPPDLPGATLVIPDVSYGRRYGGFDALFLTHGHEDHIAAVPFIVPLLRGPVYGTPLTLGLVEQLLRTHRVARTPQLVPVAAGSSAAAGPFEVEFVPVTHSMPDCAALAIQTPVGTFVHSGDFKVDATPIDGRPMALGRLEALGQNGVLALFAESTGADIPGHAGSESSIVPTYRQLIDTTRGKIIVVVYASSLHLLQILVDLATEADRRIAFMGYRLGSIADTAERLGYLHVPAGVRVRDTLVGDVPAERLVCVVTGSQGTAGSTLALLAENVHRALRVEPRDRVVFAAGPIPGNEQRVGAIKDALARLGAEIVEGDSVHVSGHARQEELKLLASVVHPRFFVPLHGTRDSLVSHARLVREVTAGRTRTLVVENGDVVRFKAESMEITERIATGRLAVDGRQIEPLGGPAIAERLQMATDGALFVVVMRRSRTGDVAEIRIGSRGLIADERLRMTLHDASVEARGAVDRLPAERRADDSAVQQAVETAVSAVVHRQLSKRPMLATTVVPV